MLPRFRFPLIAKHKSSDKTLCSENRPQREPVKADPCQIERWVEIARKNLDEKLRFREVTMHMRHANERLDHKGNVTDIRHGTEKLDLARRKEENMRRLHDAVVKARTTGIIPDKSLAPTHTSEEIAEWAREKHHELSEQHENQWTDLAGQLIKTDFEDHTNSLNASVLAAQSAVTTGNSSASPIPNSTPIFVLD